MQRRDAVAISVFVAFAVFMMVYEWYSFPQESALARGLYAFSDGILYGFAILGLGAWWWARQRGRVRMGRRQWAKVVAIAVAAWLVLATSMLVYDYLYFAAMPEWQGYDLNQFILPIYLPFSLKWSAILFVNTGLVVVLAAMGLVYAMGVLSRTFAAQNVADLPKVTPTIWPERGDPGRFRPYQAKLLSWLYFIPSSLDTTKAVLRPRQMEEEFPHARFRRMVGRCLLLLLFMALVVGLSPNLTPYLGVMTTFLGFFMLMIMVPPMVVIATELLNSVGIEIPGTVGAHRLGDGLWRTFSGLLMGFSVVYGAARVIMAGVPLDELVLALTFYFVMAVPFSLVACWYYLNFAERDFHQELVKTAKGFGMPLEKPRRKRRPA